MTRLLHKILPVALVLNVAPVVLAVCIHMTG
jgi:hypothetical protein